MTVDTQIGWRVYLDSGSPTHAILHHSFDKVRTVCGQVVSGSYVYADDDTTFETIIASTCRVCYPSKVSG